MLSLAKPSDDAKVAFTTCISKVRNTKLKHRLGNVANDVANAAAQFEAAASAGEAYKIPAATSIRNVVTAAEMSDVYTFRMAKAKTPGRELYDRLLRSPVNERCPLCGAGKVTTLDHYLPKAHYPALVVVPINLVPSCKDCNVTRRDAMVAIAEEQTLHPYYDKVDDVIWLVASVVETSPAALRFRVEPPAGWSAVMIARMRYHFKTLKLAELYIPLAADELSDTRDMLERLHARAGAEGVRAHLADEAQSRTASRKNSWMAAMYRALAASKWFYEGGFR
jgi:hypothetical protein